MPTPEDLATARGVILDVEQGLRARGGAQLVTNAEVAARLGALAEFVLTPEEQEVFEARSTLRKATILASVARQVAANEEQARAEALGPKLIVPRG